jgi:hypothetical protein
MKIHHAVALAALLGVSLRSADAQFLAESHPFAVVAHTAGAGSPPTFWRSDVVVFNPTASILSVGFQFLPEGQPNIFDGTFTTTRQLGPRETLVAEDVLASMFGFTGNQKGALLVSASNKSFPSNPTDAALLATSRTYNSGNPQGTFGQTVASCLYYWNASKEPSVATGALQDQRSRTNLGIVSFSPKVVTVHYRVRRADSAVLVEGSKLLQTYSMGQWSLSEQGVANQTGPLTVELWLDPADVTPNPCSDPDNANAFVGYVSKVDGNPTGTGDGEFIYAVPTTSPPFVLACEGAGS